MKIRVILMVMVAVLVAACNSGPSQEVTNGDVLLTETFDSEDAWENFTASDNSLQLFVGGGVYNIVIASGTSGYIWGLNSIEHTDVVIEVTTRQLATTERIAYGVMCRADTSNDGDGYYFLVSGDGFYSIAKGEGPSVNGIVDWSRSNAVNQGVAVNNIRAVCMGDYLALYVNGNFVAEANDTTYSSGYAGFAGALGDEGDGNVTFDNLNIYAPVIGSS